MPCGENKAGRCFTKEESTITVPAESTVALIDADSGVGECGCVPKVWGGAAGGRIFVPEERRQPEGGQPESPELSSALTRQV